MHARVTRFQCDAARLDEMVAMIPAVREQVSAISGGTANWAVWNDDGSGMAIAIYESEAAAAAAQPQIQQVWAGLAQLLTAPPEVMAFSNAENMRSS